MRSNLRIVPNLIILPKRELVKMGERWIIYLSKEYAELWEELKRQGKKVRVYIEVIDS